MTTCRDARVLLALFSSESLPSNRAASKRFPFLLSDLASVARADARSRKFGVFVGQNE